ncbi:DUF2232 domain-containing protein [Thioalkalivibrio sulfidiphilus]|uniref:DUF2232 domain-containing protein n=1 Tax=Thioalkalivibrio sulfidiphilus (strain HL-EbGR7) TaxID=396588 RepID=B8GNS4_THISH|nr:DUF2232 domain-containing protein [Thioalkalivibrio sulfidiphilus]ACL72013.1 conserved hypothetical protein [Thioalkalivibrio sulfidiphilus HL-EbGr7]
MKALASFIMQGRLRAVTTVAGFGAAGLIIPPMGLVASAAVALVALRLGTLQGLWVLLMASALLAGLVWVGGVQPAVGFMLGAVQWLPMLLLAHLLRQTVSWPVSLLAGVAVACGGILLVHASVPDVTEMWVQTLHQILGPVFQQSGTSAAELDEALRQAAPLMTGMLAAALLMSLALALVLARYWQAQLYNPGGFADEFQRLQLGRVPALVLAGLMLGAWMTQSTLLIELSLVFLVVFFLQGIALVHGLTRQLEMHKFWLVGMYVLMVIALPQVMIMLSAFGAIDSVADFRARFARKA